MKIEGFRIAVQHLEFIGRLYPVRKLTIAGLLASMAANACTGLLAIAAQRQYAPITATTTFDGD